MTTTDETTLMSFCELLNKWNASRAADDLATAFAAIDAAMRRGQTDMAKLMCRRMSTVTGTAVTIAVPHAWAADKLH